MDPIGEYIAFDVGSARIGVARANTIAKIAEPLDTILVGSDDGMSDMIKVIADTEPLGVVVGLPRGLDGQETSQTEYCRTVAVLLKSKVNIPVYMIDEAATSVESDSIADKGSRDSKSAVIFLEDFINTEDKDLLRLQ